MLRYESNRSGDVTNFRDIKILQENILGILRGDEVTCEAHRDSITLEKVNIPPEENESQSITTPPSVHTFESH